MALKFKILVVCLLLACTAGAQQLGIKWGEPYKNRKNSYITKVIGEGSNSYYALRYSGGYVFSYIPHVWLEKYDAFSMQQEFSTEVDIPTRDGDPVEVDDIYHVKGRMLLVGTYLNREADKKSIYAYVVDTTGKVSKEYREVDYIPLETRRDNRMEYIAVTADSAALMLYHTEADKTTGNERLICRLIDNNLKERFFKSVDIPYKQERVSIAGGLGDAAGNFYIMLRIADIKEGLFQKETTSYAYLLLAIAADGTVREYDMDLGGGPKVTEAMLKRAPDGNILVAGFYTNRNNTDNGIAGTFYIRIDGASGAVASKGIQAFEKSFLELFMKNRKIEKGVELSSYKLNDIIVRPDQGVILVAEQTFEDVVCFYDMRSGIQTCNNHYYFNDIIIASISPGGAVEWVRKIPKQQETVNDGGLFSSYLLAQRNGKLYLVFNDNIRNFEYGPTNIGVIPGQPINQQYDPIIMTSPQKAEVALVTVDSAGVVTKAPFFNAKDDKVVIRPGLSYRANDDVIIVYGEYNGRYRLGKLIYKD